jgi:hypothetical protein
MQSRLLVIADSEEPMRTPVTQVTGLPAAFCILLHGNPTALETDGEERAQAYPSDSPVAARGRNRPGRIGSSGRAQVRE